MSNRAAIDSGWIQINNTVVPYVKRHLANDLPVQLVPLPVVRYGAELLHGVHVQTLKATPGERKVLNNRCETAGLNFVFDDDIDLIPVYDVVRKYRKDVYVSFLPEDDPLGSAEFHVELCTKASHCTREKCTSSGSCTREQSTTNCRSSISTADNSEDVTFVLDLSRKAASVRQTVNRKRDQVSVNGVPPGTKENPIDLTLKTSSGNEIAAALRSSIIPASSTSSVRQPPDSVRGPIRIVPVRLRDHVVPSIAKGDCHYVLVETIRKAYFSDCSLTAFIFIARRYIGPYMYNLSQEDIDAVLTFVRSPSCLKRCTKVVTIRDADQMIPVIKRFLARVRSRVKHKHEAKPTDGSSNEDNVPAPLPIRS